MGQQPLHPLQVGVGPRRYVQQVDEGVGVAVVGQHLRASATLSTGVPSATLILT